MLDSVFKDPPGLQELMAYIVNRDRGVMHAAKDGELVRLFGRAREDLRDLDARHVGLDQLVGAADLRRSAWLHVEGIELGWTADQQQEDAAGVRLGIRRRGLRRCAKELGHARTERRQRYSA